MRLTAKRVKGKVHLRAGDRTYALSENDAIQLSQQLREASTASWEGILILDELAHFLDNRS